MSAEHGPERTEVAAAAEKALQANTGAPLVLITGLPGSGKSLRALAEFAVGKQQVYQWNIPGCTLPTWNPVDWEKLPAGSTLIVDEAREIYPPKSPTSDPPDHYKLHRIRHLGVSLVIIAQHPNDLDSRVRRLVGRHIHMVSVFGTEAAMVHQWPEVHTDVENRADSVSSLWRYPKAVYKLYKSADQHRKTVNVPWKVRLIPWLVGGALVAFLGGGWWVYRTMSPSAIAATASAGTAGGGKGPVRPSGDGPGRGEKAVSPAELSQHVPRVAGLPHTAPRYDDVTAPVEAPYPAACVSTRTRCECYTQQATRMQVPMDMCRQIVANGYFVDWKPAAPDARQGAWQAAGSPIVHAAGVGQPQGPSVVNLGGNPRQHIIGGQQGAK